MTGAQMRIAAIVLGVLGMILILSGGATHSTLLDLLAVLCFLGAAVASFMMRRRA